MPRSSWLSGALLRLRGWPSVAGLLVIYLVNEGLFAVTRGYWGPGYILVREALIPILCIAHIIVTLVAVAAERGWARRSTLAVSILGSAGLIYLQWIWQGSLFLRAP